MVTRLECICSPSDVPFRLQTYGEKTLERDKNHVIQNTRRCLWNAEVLYLIHRGLSRVEENLLHKYSVLRVRNHMMWGSGCRKTRKAPLSSLPAAVARLDCLCSPSGVPLGFPPPHTHCHPRQQQTNHTPRTACDRKEGEEKERKGRAHRREKPQAGRTERERERERAKGLWEGGQRRRQEFLLLAQGFGLIALRGEALAAVKRGREEVAGPLCLWVVMLRVAGGELCMLGAGADDSWLKRGREGDRERGSLGFGGGGGGGGVVAHRCSVDRASVRRSVQEVEGERNY